MKSKRATSQQDVNAETLSDMYDDLKWLMDIVGSLDIATGEHGSTINGLEYTVQTLGSRVATLETGNGPVKLFVGPVFPSCYDTERCLVWFTGEPPGVYAWNGASWAKIDNDLLQQQVDQNTSDIETLDGRVDAIDGQHYTYYTVAAGWVTVGKLLGSGTDDHRAAALFTVYDETTKGTLQFLTHFNEAGPPAVVVLTNTASDITGIRIKYDDSDSTAGAVLQIQNGADNEQLAVWLAAGAIGWQAVGFEADGNQTDPDEQNLPSLETLDLGSHRGIFTTDDIYVDGHKLVRDDDTVDADTLGGEEPSYYATESEMSDADTKISDIGTHFFTRHVETDSTTETDYTTYYSYTETLGPGTWMIQTWYKGLDSPHCSYQTVKDGNALDDSCSVGNYFSRTLEFVTLTEDTSVTYEFQYKTDDSDYSCDSYVAEVTAVRVAV